MLDPAALIDQLGGVARSRSLSRFGISRHALADAVSSSDVLRVRTGVFATPRTDRRVIQAAAHGGSLTCASALRMHGIWTLEDDTPHVWMGLSGRRHHNACDCVSHFFEGPTRFGIVEVETALIHIHACRGGESFFVAFESAWNKGRIPRAARERIRAALPANARWLCDLARGDAESGLESLLRFRLHLVGVSLESQVTIPGVGRVDFVLAGRVILEVDGRLNHAGIRRHHDLMRDAEASRLGYETLRFDYAMVVHHWDVVLRAVLAALDRAHGRV